MGPLLFGLKIGEDVRPDGPEPWADREVHPTTPWNYALDLSKPLVLDKETLTVRQIYGKNEQFPHTRISAMIQDREGNIWLCGDRSGLQRVYPYLRTQPLPAGQTEGVRALLADRQGRLWVAGNGGLTCISGEQQSFIAVPGLRGQIISLYQDAQGWIWIGSFGEGVWRYHPEQKTFLHMTEAEGLSNGSVLSISGRGTEVWLATLGGVTRCRLGDSGETYCEALDAPGGISLNYVYCIFPDSRGRIWFGTDGQGLFVRENSHITRFGETEGLKSEVVYSIAEDPQGRIWFNTSDAGIYCYDGKQFRQFTAAEGLRDDHSLSLISDNQGRLISVHNGGLSLIETTTGQITVFGPESGVGELDPDLNAVSADAGGRIWIGAQQKLLCYLPPALSYRMTPLTALDRIQIFLNDLTDSNLHEFESDQNHLTFSFSGLWFRDPDAVTYQYQLEGYDLGWISTRESRAIYPRLSHGQYHFRVRSFVNGKPEDAPVLQYDFRIRPPFWSTPWFVILALLALAGAVYYFIRSREKRLRSQALLEQERIRFEFETLRNQVNPHFLFNSFNTLISIIEEDKDSAVEYVNRLSDLFRNMLAYREKSLISLKEELELLETYVYLQKKRYGDNLRLDFSVSDDDLSALIPPLTLQMLIENAVKHNVISRSQPLSIELRTTEGYLSVRNRIARKRSPVASTRLGLQNIRERYRILSDKDKEMKVEEGPEYFSVSIPLL
ncbi:MAG: hypothetical protein EAZ89_14320 [Bacteroidetes bacterium]|nr:MAG: hypothetical protein EAZ89_14320 [Bacteroidota bacterium]